MTNDVSDTAELSGGGGGSFGPLHNFGGVGRGDQCWGHFTTGVCGPPPPPPECPCEDQEKQPLAGMNKPVGGTVSEGDTRSPVWGVGALPPSGAAGGSFRLMLWMHQRFLLSDLGRFPRGFRWCWSTGPWLGTLRDGSVHVRTGIGDRGLEPVCL